MPSAKKAAPPAPKKKAAVKQVTEGAKLSCEVCGLVVTVDEECGCIEACDIICCGEPMQEKKARVRTAKAKPKAKAKA